MILNPAYIIEYIYRAILFFLVKILINYFWMNGLVLRNKFISLNILINYRWTNDFLLQLVSKIITIRILFLLEDCSRLYRLLSVEGNETIGINPRNPNSRFQIRLEKKIDSYRLRGGDRKDSRKKVKRTALLLSFRPQHGPHSVIPRRVDVFGRLFPS